MALEIHITDLFGDELCRFEQFHSAEVVIPFLDSRTARCEVSIYDSNVNTSNIQPGNRMLKVWYNKHLVFWGRIGKPVWDANKKTVEINAIDATIMWKHKYHRYGDIAVDRGYYLDGTGLYTLASSAHPTNPQIARGIPIPGVYWGLDFTTHTIHNPNPVPVQTSAYGNAAPPEGAGWFRKIARGTQVWQSMIDLCNFVQNPYTYPDHGVLPGLFGMEFDLVPVDINNPPVTNINTGGVITPKAWKRGYHTQLNVYDQLGSDKRSSVIWHCGWGKNNATNVVYEPDVDQMRNYAVAVPPGGPNGYQDAKRIGLAHDEDSWLLYGIYGEWLASGSQYDLNATLQARAQYTVDAYAFPPDFFTIYPQREFATAGQMDAAKAEELPYRFIDDYYLGDVVHASVKKGNYRRELDGRITKVTLTQVDADRNVQVGLECVPDFAANTIGGSGDEAFN